MKSDGINTWPDIQPPVVGTPLQGATFVAALGFTATLMPIIYGLGMGHTSTDYELRTAPGGAGTLMWASNADLALLVKIVPGTLGSGVQSGQTYYFRARFHAGALTSEWSEDRRLVAI